MPSLVVLVLAKPEKLPDVLQAWQDAEAPEATVLESTGLGRVSEFFGRDDVPLFPSLRALDECRECIHHTVFSVVEDDGMVDRLIAATEGVVGDLSQPNTGIMFVVPVARVIGYRPAQETGSARPR
jgi:nitrogen regulatory protein P-II 1